MGEINKINSYMEFFYYAFRNILIVSIPLVIISAIVLSSFHSSATTSGSDNLAITISSSCTLSSVVNVPHNAEVYNGNYLEGIGKTTIKTLCNDGNGYSVYAVGYSNNKEGNNKLINSERPEYSIDTGLATSGLISAWAMKLNNIPDDPSPTPPVIEQGYNNTYGIVPPYWTKVASRASGTTDMAQGSSFTTTYAVYASSSQYAGTYQGQVKYLLTHPAADAKYFFMQDIANWKDQMLPNEGDSILAVDQRDGKTYWVTKLADGNIWMTQNLDLDLDPAKPLTSNDTDLTDHSLTGAYADGYSYDPDTGVTTWTPEIKTIEFEGDTFTGWTNDTSNPYSANKTDDTNTGHTSLGNWYNYTAAIASNNSASLTTSTYNNIANSPKNSICPKGWRLPTISSQSESDTGSTNEFARLNLLYNNNLTNTDTGLISQPLYFTRSGYAYSNRLNKYSVSGTYLSSTVYDSNMAYSMRFKSDIVNPINYNDDSSFSRRLGWPIRCVAR